MNTPAFPIRRLLIGTVPSVLILLLAYLVYNYHKHAFSDYQSRRSFRALNNTGNQITSKLTALEEVVSKSDSGDEPSDYLHSLDLFSLQTKDSAGDQLHFSSKSGDWSPNLQNIFEPLMRLDLFDSLVLAKLDGTVLVQRSNTPVRFTDLRASIQERLTGVKEDKPAPSATKSNQPATNIAPHTDAFPITIAGDQYNVFLHPILWRAADKKEYQWVLAGFSKQAEFRLGGVLDPRYLEFLFILCITLVAGWPLQKLIGLTPDERIRRRDAQLFLISGVLLVTMCICWMLDFYYDSIWEGVTDNRLKVVAVEIDNHFTQELSWAYNRLTSLHPGGAGDRESCVAEPPRGLKDENVLRENVLTDYYGDYRDFPFETVEWLDQAGFQRIKWSIHSKSGPPGDRSDRDYFKDLIIRAPQFSLQRLYSRETGEKLTVMGTSLNSGQQPGCLAARVAGLQLVSGGSVVLPPNIRFAIVDETGTVMYHADDRRVLVEKFVEECEQDKDTVTANLKRAEDHKPFDAEYEGKATRMYIKAVAGHTLPEWVHWSVIVYAEKAIPEREEGEVLAKALTFLLLYVMTVVAVAWILHLSRGVWWSRPSWSEVPTRLACLFAVQLVLAVWFAALILSERSFVVFAGAFVCPLLAIATTCAALTAKVKLPSWVLQKALANQTLAGLGWPQFGAGIAFVVLIGVLPNFAFWRVAFVHHGEAVIRQGQLEMADSLERRDQSLVEQYKNINFTDPQIADPIGNEERKEEFIHSRAIERSGPANNQAPELYIDAFFDSILIPKSESICATNDTALESLEHWFRRALTPVEQRDDVRWCRGARKNQITRRNQETILYRPDLVRHLAISSVVPPSELPADGVTVTRVGGLLLVFCGLMYYAVSRLLHLDRKFVPPPASGSGQERLTDNLLLLGPPGFGMSRQLEKQDGVCIIDLTSYTPDTLRALAGQWPWSDSRPTVAIDHLEFGIDDRDWNSAKLQLLERLVYRSQKNVILVSNIDLLLYMRYGNTRFSRFGTDALFPREQRERWVDVLACFQRRDFAANEDFKIGETASAGHGYQALWRTCSEQERAVLLNLAQDGLVNPKNSGLLVELRRRGILVKNPILGFRDPAFGDFIQRVYGPDQLLSWDMAMRGSSASSSLLLGLLVLVGIGLSFTGYETIGPMVASISGLLNLLGTFKGQFLAQSSTLGSSAETRKA